MKKIYALLVILSLVLSLHGATSAEGSPEATITALASQVSSLQTQVATLSPSATPSPSVAGDQLSRSLYFEGTVRIPTEDLQGVGVAIQGPTLDNVVPVVVFNGSRDDIALISVSGFVRQSGGTLIATSAYSSLTPVYVYAGEISVGFVRFDIDSIPATAEITLQVDYEVSDQPFTAQRDLAIDEATLTPEGIVGLVSNPYSYPVETAEVHGLCFGESGEIVGYFNGTMDQRTVRPSSQAPFSARLFDSGGYSASDLDPSSACGGFVVGVTGWS